MDKVFPLRDVLSITTGRLLTKPDNRGNGIGAIYQLLEHTTGEAPYTHQLPRFAEETGPVLLAMFPELARVDNEQLIQLDTLLSEDSSRVASVIEDWLHNMSHLTGQTEFTIPEACVEHASIHPVIELTSMIEGEPDNDERNETT